MQKPKSVSTSATVSLIEWQSRHLNRPSGIGGYQVAHRREIAPRADQF